VEAGSWSFPTIFGTALSVSLIQYSKPLSYLGLVIVLGFAGISAFKLHSELKAQQLKDRRQQNIEKINKESSALG
jgi:hypothetical protein